MKVNWKARLTFITQRIWLSVAVFLILLAVLVALGRSAMVNLESYRAPFNQYVSDLLGVRFEAGSLTGDWQGFEPTLQAENVTLAANLNMQSAVTLSELRARPNLLQSLLNGKLIWRELGIGRVQLTMLEDAAGQWQVEGLPFPIRSDVDVEPNNSDLIALLGSNHLSIDNLAVKIIFYSGTSAVFNARDLFLERSGGFFRAQASVGLDEETDSARLILEGDGDATDYRNVIGKGYLTLHSINFRGALSAIVKNWFPQLVERVGDIETKLDAEVWVELNGVSDISWVGQIHAAEIPMNWVSAAEPVTNFSADLTGWFREGESWGMRGQSVDFDWLDQDIEPFNLIYSQRTGNDWGNSSLAIDQVNLTLFRSMLLATRLATDNVLTAVENLKPSGKIKLLHMDVAPGLDKPMVTMRTNLEDIETVSWKKGVATRGVSGYLEVGRNKGLFELDSPKGLGMLYPQSYQDYMQHSSAKGQLRWKLVSPGQRLKISSGLIHIGGEEGDGRAYLYLDIPTLSKKDRDHGGEMFLQAGVQGMHASYRDRYLPKTLRASLKEWFDTALGDIDLVETGFIWRGSVTRGDLERTFQLFVDARGGDLQFQPDWKPLEKLSAKVSVDDSETNGVISRAEIGGINLQAGKFQIISGESNGSVLKFDAKASGRITDIMNLLEHSPLRSQLSVFSDWQLSGNTHLNLDLSIPLEQDSDDGIYQIDIQLHDALFALRDSDIVFEQLSGDVRYHSQRGVSSKEVTGRFWGYPLQASVGTQDSSGEKRIVIDAKGIVPADRLSKFANIQGSGLLTGKSVFQAEVNLPLERDTSRATELVFTTSLQGLGIDLPAPLGKTEDAVLASKVKLTFFERLQVEWDFGQSISGHVEVLDNAVVRGELSLNVADSVLPPVDQFLVQGQLETIDLDAWQVFYQRLQNDGFFNDASQSSLQPKVNLHFGQLDVADVELNNVAVSGGFAASRWQFLVNSDMAEGEVLFEPDSPIPLSLSLSRLTLPAPAEGSDLSSVDPQVFPALNFSVGDLAIGDTHYGSTAFTIEPQPTGVLFSNIRANQQGLRFGGSDEALFDTRLLWLLEDGQHKTHFEGIVSADDIGEAFESRGLQKLLDSKQAVILADLSWPDHPLGFSGEKISGSLALDLEDGHFYRSPNGATNALIRTVGLINFSNWTRRLKLDFSDFLEKGMSYDSLNGGLHFNRGVMNFEPPMVVEMPSGRMKLIGEANLATEQIDAKLVTTLPVGTNLPWLAALAGGLPAAAGVYITGKIFEKQVDQLSSIGYSIKGPWDDPKIRVDKIFSDKLNARPSGDEK